MTQQNFMGAPEEPVGRLSNKVRIEFSIPAEKCNSVTNVLEEANLEAMIYETKSCGCKMPKPKVSVRRGTDMAELTQPPRRTIVTIVESQRVRELLDIVKESANRDTSGVVISPVYEMTAL